MDNISGGRFLLRLLNLLGLWRPTNETGNIFSTILWWFSKLLHIPFSFTITILMVVEMMRSRSLEDANDVVYMSLTEVAFIIKLSNIWQRSSYLRYYIKEITNANEFTLRTETEIEFWQRQQLIFNRFAKMYHLLCFGTFLSSYLGALFGTEYEIPFAYYVPFEWRNKRNYWYALGYNCVAMLWTSTANACLDMSICYFLRHLSLLYNLLGMRFVALKNRNEIDVTEELMSIFKMHRKLKKLTSSCEAVISPPILSQIVLSALVLCFTGYRVQKMDIMNNLGQFLAMLQFLAIVIFQIFLPCYYANEVTVNSNHLTMDVYSINWHEYSVPTRKLIFIYMEFLKRPTKLKAGGYFEIGLPIFTKTINNAYSAFALLLNISK